MRPQLALPEKAGVELAEGISSFLRYGGSHLLFGDPELADHSHRRLTKAAKAGRCFSSEDTQVATICLEKDPLESRK